MSARRNTFNPLAEQVLAMRRGKRAAELAAGGRPRATRIPSGKAYNRTKAKAGGWS